MVTLNEVLKKQSEILKLADASGLSDVKLCKSFDANVLCIFATPKTQDSTNLKAIGFNYYLAHLLKCEVTVLVPSDLKPEDKKHFLENSAPLTDIAQVKKIFGEPNQFNLRGFTNEFKSKLEEYKMICDVSERKGSMKI